MCKVYSTKYKANNSVFIPTNMIIEKNYGTNHVGDKLWEQVFNGKLTGNYYTLFQISSLGAIVHFNLTEMLS